MVGIDKPTDIYCYETLPTEEEEENDEEEQSNPEMDSDDEEEPEEEPPEMDLDERINREYSELISKCLTTMQNFLELHEMMFREIMILKHGIK